MKITTDFLTQPILETGDNKPSKRPYPKRLLFMTPPRTLEGYYSLLVPGFELGIRPEFQIRITKAQNYNYKDRNPLLICPINQEDILWADFIIFPMILQNSISLFKTYRKLNPNLQLIMHVPCSIERLLQQQRLYPSQFEKQELSLLLNLLEMDSIIFQDKRLRKKWSEKLKACSKETRNPFCYTIPFALSSLNYVNIKTREKQKNKTIRIGIPFEFDMEKERPFFKALDRLHKTYGTKLQLVVYGIMEGQIPDFIPTNMETEFHMEQPLEYYFQSLEDLKLDMILYPDWSSDQEQHDIRYKEACASGIPFLSYQFTPENQFYNKPPQLWQKTVSVDDWHREILKLITHEEMREAISIHFRQQAMRMFGYTKEHIAKYQEVFT